MLLQGYDLLRREGFTVPKSVVEATEAYSHESNKIAQFADERLEADPDAETRTAAVYDEYRQWCGDNGCYTENSRNFNHELRKFGTVVRRRPKNGGEKTTLLIGYKVRVASEFLK
jgi:putative DNA primase/helicase